MKIKKSKSNELQKYRLYGCWFTKEEYIFIKNKLKELREINGEKRNNTEILIELFKLALEDENKSKG